MAVSSRPRDAQGRLLSKEAAAALENAQIRDASLVDANFQVGPVPAEPVSSGRYDAVIGRIGRILAETTEALNYSRDGDQQKALEAKRRTLQRGLDLFTRAQSVAPERTQFGSYHARSLEVRLPPTCDEFNFAPLVFGQYRYITSEPVEILYLRDLVAKGKIEGLHEMEAGMVAAMPKTGNFIGFITEEEYTRLGKAKVLKTT